MREEPDELPEEIMDELWVLIDGPESGFWSGVDALCARHPEREAEIRREAEVMLGEAESPSREPPGGEFDDLPEAIEAEVCAVVFGEATSGDNEAALQALCTRHLTFAVSIRQLATILRAQVADMRRRLGAVWSLSHNPGRYDPIEELGGGSFGSVSIVRDRLLGRRAALKTIHARHGVRLDQIEPRIVHRFLDEAQIAAQLRHPGIPLVHDLGIGPLGVPYYTMRYVRGQTLGKAIAALHGDWPAAVHMLVQVAEAVVYAHGRGVLHRDIKPENIVVGRFGEVCVIDWGLARAARGSSEAPWVPVRTDRGVALGSGGMGSEGFMAPEARRGEFCEASDVFSLAAILHLVLLGMPPMLLDSAARYQLPRSVRRRDRALTQICERGLQPRLADRYSRMEEMLVDLRGYLAKRAAASVRRMLAGLRDGWRRLRGVVARGPAVESARSLGSRAAPTTVAEMSRGGRADDLTLAGMFSARSGPQYFTEAGPAGRRRLDALEHRLAVIRELSTPTARYRRGALIAAGGMGEVRFMRDGLLRREVAVKMLLMHADSDVATTRLLDEAQIAAQLDHPSILTVHEIGVDDDGSVRMVMPLISGGTLVVANSPGAAWRARAQLILRVAWGLAFAHEKGVVHRDVKPQNILVGEHGDAYLADWGVAVLLGVEGAGGSKVKVQRGAGLDESVDETLEEEIDIYITSEGAVVGTPAYMSPEAVRLDARTIGAHSDIWSLGVVLFEALTGQHPYAGQPRWHHGRPKLEDLVWLMSQPFPIPSARSLNRYVPPKVAAVCAHALQHDFRERFAHAGAFATALEAALAT